MPFWPFGRRRKDAAVQQMLEEKAPARAATDPTSAPPTASIPRRTSGKSKSSRREKKRLSHQREEPVDIPRIPDILDEKRAATRSLSLGKEEVLPGRGSIESITALPSSRKLETSPHLRPADLPRPPPIPYNFRQHSTSSHSSIQHQGTSTSNLPSRPNTLRSKRSTYDKSNSNNTLPRRRSTKKRGNGSVREEEIRSMNNSSPIPIPKRPGDGPLQRDSRKARGLSGRESTVSLPPEDPVHSTMSGFTELRGWKVGSLDVFNPRPAVRLSGLTQRIEPSSLPNTCHLNSIQGKKLPVTRETVRNLKRQTIGDEADELGASDLRVLLERDEKRRERRKLEQHEKLDRKLQSRVGRDHADSSKKRRDVDEVLRAEEDRRIRELVSPPTAIHPALRNRPVENSFETPAETVGLGTGPSGRIEPTSPSTEPARTIPANPFVDPVPVSPTTKALPPIPPALTQLETHMEDPVLRTAQAIRYSHASTPPLSPIHPPRRASAGTQQAGALGVPQRPLDDRRISEPRDRRAGAWTSFFRRGSTMSRKPGDVSPSEFSFSNTSRESMRNQPLPAHLVDTTLSRNRTSSGTPVRTMSKFREDLPEMPLSPPDSRTQSPDVTTMAAAAAAARRAKRAPNPLDVAEDERADSPGTGRNDTPVSPMRIRGLVSASLASVDSEGSWLAGSANKRVSVQSGLSRSMGSLSRRRPEFTSSYEELGGDTDAEYFQRMSVGSIGRQLSGSAVPGANTDGESEYGDNAAASESDPLKVHKSVRRQPTLVHRDRRVKSREGLLTEYSATEIEPEIIETPSATPLESPSREHASDENSESSDPQLHSAKSIMYGTGHARKVSAGSVQLLDMPKRGSTAGLEQQPGTPSQRSFSPSPLNERES